MARLAVDRALQRLAATGDGGGLANHGPMAVHALAELGVDEAGIRRWLDRCLPRLDEPPPETAPLEGDWREVLRAEGDVVPVPIRDAVERAIESGEVLG